jgi:ABC-type metal ion transport system substrate-binding protein
MKYLEKNQLITLEDNKKYLVADSIIHNDSNFAYVINIDDNKDQLLVLATKENDELSINVIDNKSEENKSIIETLSNIFSSDLVDKIVEEGLYE